MLFGKRSIDLPKVTAPTAAEVAARSKPSAEGKALLTPGATPGEYLGTLEKNKLSVDSVHFLAHGLPAKDSICWAAKSSRMVAPKLSMPELNALKIAEGWLKAPSLNMQSQLMGALHGIDFTGPGGWTAQAALWSMMPGLLGGLVPSAVAGAIMLAGGLSVGAPMPAVPKPKLPLPVLPPTPQMLAQLKVPRVALPAVPALNQPALMKMLSPFLQLGHGVGAGSICC